MISILSIFILLITKGSTMKHIESVRFFLSMIAMLVLVFPVAVHADSGGTNAEQAFNMEVVGHNDLGGRGFNADVWVHKGYAYVGQWGFGDWASGSKDRFCPTGSNTSALILDARFPSNPQIVGRLQNPPNTSIEDLVVYTAQYGAYKGHEIAAGGIQFCGDSLHDATATHGLMLWDVTNPAAPQQLAYFNTGCCAEGVHEFEVESRTDLQRTFAYATVPSSRYPDSTSPCRSRTGVSRISVVPSMPGKAVMPIPTMDMEPNHPRMAGSSFSPIGTAASLPLI
jgi:hypothetical protein